MAKIKVDNTEISVVTVQNEDYISLTDMAHSQMQEHIIFRWMSLKSTIEYLGEWEKLYNPFFNCTEFDTIKCNYEQIQSFYRIISPNDRFGFIYGSCHRVEFRSDGGLHVCLRTNPMSA